MRIFLLSLLILSACSSVKTPEELAKHPEEAPPQQGPVKDPQSSIEAKELGAEEQAKEVVELRFAKGRANLSAAQLQKLIKVLKTTKGPIGKIHIVSWSDVEYPADAKTKLPEAQIQLATKRGDFIEEKAKKLYPDASFEKFNMAERPGAFANWYSSTDASIKNSLEKSGIDEAKVSRAIVMIIAK